MRARLLVLLFLLPTIPAFAGQGSLRPLDPEAGLMSHMAKLQEHMRYLDQKVEYFWKLEQREQAKRVDVQVVSPSV